MTITITLRIDTINKQNQFRNLITIGINRKIVLDEMDQYEVIGSLGEGSFGRVYKAKHLTNGQIVALKVISKVCILFDFGRYWNDSFISERTIT